MVTPRDVERFLQAATLPTPGELAPAAFAIARLAYPRLDATPYLARLDEMGREVASRIGTADEHGCVAIIAQYLFDDLGFSGNRDRYTDPRNSFLNDVLDRRTGIPITLGVVFIEIARRIDLAMYGVNFPGHFLLTVMTSSGRVILDPFEGGTVLSMADCEELWDRHVTSVDFDPAVLTPASKPEVVARMLHNLKRIYVEQRAFCKARDVSELLVALDPTALAELRDRGLIAYQQEDFAAALRDLQTYLQLSRADPAGVEQAAQEQGQVWEHVKTLRRRVAGLN